jgi:hypothetical protein
MAIHCQTSLSIATHGYTWLSIATRMATEVASQMATVYAVLPYMSLTGRPYVYTALATLATLSPPPSSLVIDRD